MAIGLMNILEKEYIKSGGLKFLEIPLEVPISEGEETETTVKTPFLEVNLPSEVKNIKFAYLDVLGCLVKRKSEDEPTVISDYLNFTIPLYSKIKGIYTIIGITATQESQMLIDENNLLQIFFMNTNSKKEDVYYYTKTGVTKMTLRCFYEE